jgi:hypothetical protein
MATTPESFVDALNSAFGKQTTQRAAHAKGVAFLRRILRGSGGVVPLEGGRQIVGSQQADEEFLPRWVILLVSRRRELRETAAGTRTHGPRLSLTRISNPLPITIPKRKAEKSATMSITVSSPSFKINAVSTGPEAWCSKLPNRYTTDFGCHLMLRNSRLLAKSTVAVARASPRLSETPAYGQSSRRSFRIRPNALKQTIGMVHSIEFDMKRRLAPAKKRLASSSPTPDCCGDDAPVPRHVFAACLFRPPARNSIGLVARNGNESLRFVVDAEPQALGMLAM